MIHILNTLCLFKYINEKPDFKCTYHVNLHVIYITNHTNPVLHVVNTYRRHGAKGAYLTLVRVADRIL